MTVTSITTSHPVAATRATVPGARRFLLWTGIVVLLIWVILPIYFVALGAFGGRLGVFRWPKSRSGQQISPSPP
jgi:multiple sugar transport system permease protein